jgi:hypothetical protein
MKEPDIRDFLKSEVMKEHTVAHIVGSSSTHGENMPNGDPPDVMKDIEQIEQLTKWIRQFVEEGHHEDVGPCERVYCAYCGREELWNNGKCLGIEHERGCTLIRAKKYLGDRSV